MKRELHRGISFGNALDTGRGEVPRFRILSAHLAAVSRAGFDFVRLPVRWSAYAEESEPYQIDGRLFERVDRVLEDAERCGLTVIVNVHHYHEIQRAPHAHAARLAALWRQISDRYVGRGESLFFELLNEPHGALTAPLWNDLLRLSLGAVREISPDRAVIVGPVSANDAAALSRLSLPQDDCLIATIHYYAPFEFTHQGARWIDGADRWLRTQWGDGADRAAVTRDLSQAAVWAREHDLPLLIGEFGTHDQADLGSRRSWTAFVRSQAERLGLAWCYWDFGTDFGAWDPDRNAWRTPILDALLATTA